MIGKSILRGIFDTFKLMINIMLGSIIGYLVVLNIQGVITGGFFQRWTIIVIIVALPFNIAMRIIYDHYCLDD